MIRFPPPRLEPEINPRAEVFTCQLIRFPSPHLEPEIKDPNRPQQKRNAGKRTVFEMEPRTPAQNMFFLSFRSPRPTRDWSGDVANGLDTVRVVPIYKHDVKPLRPSFVVNDRYTRSHP